MEKLIAIQSILDEVRVAIVENGNLAEIQIEQTKDQGIGGNVYKGRVVRVLPGLATRTRGRNSSPSPLHTRWMCFSMPPTTGG